MKDDLHFWVKYLFQKMIQKSSTVLCIIKYTPSET